ncbi:MAG: PfkB family carbohydrate kinase [Caulobacteraceae bacterium]
MRGWEVPLALDASGPVLRKALAQRPFLIKPNLHELRELSGEALIDEPSRIAAARAVVQAGQAHAVALTLGPDGALLVAREGAWRAAALPISPVSAVGAGDSFLGGMAVSIAAGEDLPAAFRRGVAAASAALLAHGTELCRADVVARLLPQVRVEEIAGAVAA